jgi:hypothetical protein
MKRLKRYPRCLTILLLGASLIAGAAETPDAPETMEAEDAAAEAAEETAPPEEAAAKRDWLSGTLELSMDGIAARRAHDLDLHQWLRFQVDPPDHPKLRISGSVWLTEDLDGDEARRNSLYDIDNAYGSDIRARLLHLYLEAKDVLGGATLRVGRQRILDGPLYNRVDGLYLKWNRPKWDLYLYGGARASLYEDSHDDLVLGAGVGYRPFASTRLGFDVFYADDHRGRGDAVRPDLLTRLFGYPYPREVDREADNTLLALSLHQRLGQHAYARARMTFLEDMADEFLLDITGYWPGGDLTYSASYRRQLERVNDRVNDITGYYRILGPQEKYHHLYLSLHRPITERLALSLEGDFHDADRDSPLTANRDYVRTAVMLTAAGLQKRWEGTAGLERWDVSDGEDAWVVTGEITRRWDKVRLSFGADYERWRDEYVGYSPWPYRGRQLATYLLPGLYPGFMPLVYLLDQRSIVVREDIYSLYARVRWEVKEGQRFSARLTFEEDDGPNAPYWRLQAAYEIDF